MQEMERPRSLNWRSISLHAGGSQIHSYGALECYRNLRGQARLDRRSLSARAGLADSRAGGENESLRKRVCKLDIRRHMSPQATYYPVEASELNREYRSSGRVIPLRSYDLLSPASALYPDTQIPSKLSDRTGGRL